MGGKDKRPGKGLMGALTGPAVDAVHGQPKAPLTLCIDIGGTGLKAALVDADAHLCGTRVRIDTPYPCPPDTMVEALAGLVEPLRGFERVSVGFPGVVRAGRVLTAPHYGNDVWHQFPLADTLARRLGQPTRLLNDAEVQGLALIRGHGVETVLTLGTGVGSAVFRDGVLMVHLELAQHPLHGAKTYNEYVGNAVLRERGPKVWNRHVGRMVDTVRMLINFDALFIAGGNARKIDAKTLAGMGAGVSLASNEAGLIGGVKLWERPDIGP